MYGVDDLYRIKDLSHSMDYNHWVGKEHLAKKFCKLYNHDAGKLLVLGGWYGMMAYQLRKQWPQKQMNIESTDMDPMCEEFGYELFGDKAFGSIYQTLNLAPALGSYMFSAVLAAKFYEENADSNNLCCGQVCYRTTHLITGCCTACGVIIMFCLHLKVKSYYVRKYE